VDILLLTTLAQGRVLVLKSFGFGARP